VLRNAAAAAVLLCAKPLGALLLRAVTKRGAPESPFPGRVLAEFGPLGPPMAADMEPHGP